MEANVLNLQVLLYKNSRCHYYDAFGNAIGNSIVGKIQQTERDKKLAAQKAFDDLKKQYENQIPDFTQLELDGYGEIPTETIIPDFTNLDLAGYGDGPLPDFIPDFTNLDIPGYGEVSPELVIPDFTVGSSDGIYSLNNNSFIDKIGNAVSKVGTGLTAYDLSHRALKRITVVDEVFNSIKAIPQSLITPSSLVDDVIPTSSSGFLDVLGKGFFLAQTAYEVPKFVNDEVTYFSNNGQFSDGAVLKGVDLGISTGLGYAAAFVNPLYGIPALAYTFRSEIYDGSQKGFQLQQNEIKNNPTQFPIGPKF